MSGTFILACSSLNWQTTGALDQISPVLCRCEQMLMPLADQIGRDLYQQRDPLFLHKHYYAAYRVLSVIEDALNDQRSPLPQDPQAGLPFCRLFS